MESTPTTKQGTKLVAYYGRVSTSNQEDQKTIKNQEMELDTLAEELYGTGGYVVVRRYYDEGWSGDILERPQLDQLRQDAKAGIWDVVLVYDPDRLARRYHFQRVVQDELEEARKELRFKTRSEPRDDMERVLYGVQGLFAEYERVKIRERFRIGKLRKAKNKHIITSVAPYGYTLVKRRGKPTDTDFTETHLIINPVEARVVRMLFEWVGNEGVTLRKIIRRLRDMGIQPRKNAQGLWRTNTLSTLLRRESYVGQSYFGVSTAIVPVKPQKTDVKYRKVKKTSRMIKPKEDWIPIPVPAILEGAEGRALFDRARRRLKENFDDSMRGKQHHYLLAERVRCVCGCTRTGEGPQRGKYLYYRCSNRVLSFPLPRTCKEKGIDARIADAMVWEKVAQLMSSHELMREQIEQWKKQQDITNNLTGIDVDLLRSEIDKLKKQESRYNLAYGEGALELSKLVELAAPIKKRLGELEAEMSRATLLKIEREDMSILSSDEVSRVVIEAIDFLRDLNFAQKRDIVLDVIDGTVGVPGRLVVNGYLPVAKTSPAQYDILINGEPFHVRYKTSNSYAAGTPQLKSYVELKTSDRYCRAPQRREINSF